MPDKKLLMVISLQILLLVTGKCWATEGSSQPPIHVIFDIDGTFLAGGKGERPEAEVIIGNDHFHLAKDIQFAFRYLAEIPSLRIGFYSGSRTAFQKIQSVKVGPKQTAIDLANGRILNTPYWMVRIADKPDGTIFENFRKDLTLFESDLERIIIFEDEWSVLDEQFKNLIHIGKVFPDNEHHLEIVDAQDISQIENRQKSIVPGSNESHELAIWLSHHRAARMVGVVKRALEDLAKGQANFVEAARKANSTPITTTLFGLKLINSAKVKWCKESLN